MYDYATRQEQLKIESAVVNVSTQVETFGNKISFTCDCLLVVLVLSIIIKIVRSLL